ncbi:MAG: hypothetical protein LCH79_16030 [Proteobacteria bacterium]|nr:hypothetical protein [Pseudomonadota bacterium]
MTPSTRKAATSKAGAAPAPAQARAAAPTATPAATAALAPDAAKSDVLVVGAGPTVSTDGASEAGGESAVLIGSGVLPSMVPIGGQEVQLGVVVAGAHAASGLSVADWNALAGDVREQMLSDYVASQTEAAKVLEDQERADAAAAARAEADAEAQRLAAKEDEHQANAQRQAQEAQARAAANEFPCVIEVGNNSGIALSEPVSGAHIQAGGTGRITLLSLEHAHQVQQNLMAVLDLNYLDPGVLVITKLPK